MASTSIPIRAVGVQACARSDHRRSNPDRWRTSSANWWTPLFGWSSEPDYINTENKGPSVHQVNSVTDPSAKESKQVRPRFSGGFTAEKAKQLRMMTVGTETFHDRMYHSAIASRLASDFKEGSDL